MCITESVDVARPLPTVVVSREVRAHDSQSTRSKRPRTAVRPAVTHNGILRPIAHWWRFNIRRQASTPGDRAGRTTDTRYQYQRLYLHTSNIRTQQFSARCSIYGKELTREDKSSKWLHPASPPIKTIIWWCFAAGVDAVMLRSEEKANKRRTVWS